MGRGEGKIATGRFRLTDPCNRAWNHAEKKKGKENGVILDISWSQNSLRVLVWYLTSKSVRPMSDFFFVGFVWEFSFPQLFSGHALVITFVISFFLLYIY